MISEISELVDNRRYYYGCGCYTQSTSCSCALRAGTHSGWCKDCTS